MLLEGNVVQAIYNSLQSIVEVEAVGFFFARFTRGSEFESRETPADGASTGDTRDVGDTRKGGAVGADGHTCEGGDEARGAAATWNGEIFVSGTGQRWRQKN